MPGLRQMPCDGAAHDPWSDERDLCHDRGHRGCFCPSARGFFCGFIAVRFRLELCPMNTLAKIESALPLPVTVDDILAARAHGLRCDRADAHAAQQDLLRHAGAKVYLKFENLQFTAAYKEARRATTQLLQLGGKPRRRA